MKKAILIITTITFVAAAGVFIAMPKKPKVFPENKCSVWDKSSKGFYWNNNGEKTLPQNIDCWDGYGATASIIVPNGSTYENTNIRFWNNAVVIGSFKTKTLSSINHTVLSDKNIYIDFIDPINITDEVILQQSKQSPDKGVVLSFKKGLEGKPKCFVMTMDNNRGVNTKNSFYTCSCSASECRINKPTKIQKLLTKFFRKNSSKLPLESNF